MARSNFRNGANIRPRGFQRTVQKTIPKTFDCPHCGEAIEFDDNFKPVAIDILSQPALPPAVSPQMDTSSRLRHLLDEPPTNEIPVSAYEETPVIVTVQPSAPKPPRQLPDLRWLYGPASLTVVGALLFFICVVGLGFVVYNSTAPQVTPVVNVSLPTRNPTRLAQQNNPVPEDQTQAAVFLPTATDEVSTPDQTTGPDINAPAGTSSPDENPTTPEVLGPAVGTQQPSETIGVASNGQGFGVTGERGNSTTPSGTLTPLATLNLTPTAVVTQTITPSTLISASPTVTATISVKPTATAGLPNPLAASSSGGLSSALPPNTFAPAPPVLQVNNQAGWINQVTFSADGKMVATANSDFSVRLWDATTGKAIKTLWGHSGSVYSLSFSPDGQLLASAGADKSVIVWDITSGKQVHRMTGHTAGINSVTFSPGGQILATGSSDLSVRLWDVSSGKQIGIAQAHQGAVQTVAFSPDAKQLASGGDDHLIMLWDLTSLSNPTQRATLKGHNSKVWLVTFSPDGQKLASASLDSTDNLKVWDLNAGKELFNLTGHDQGVYSVAFSPDGKLLASGGMDRTVRLWNPSTGDTLGTYTGSTATVTSVSFSPDGKLLVGAGADKIIRLWKVDAS